MKFGRLGTALIFALGAGSVSAAPPEAAPPPPADAPAAKDPAAMALVNRMCERFRTARTFTIRGRIAMELPLSSGAQATFVNEIDTAVRRPNGLAAHRRGDLPELRFAYDGKSMTVLAPAAGKWGTVGAPATLDAMLVAADQEGDINMPFDEFLVADPCAAITPAVTAAVRGPPAVVNGKKTEHVVLTGPFLQLEYWIDPATALPARSLVIYTDQPLRPHFTAEISEWKLDVKLPDSTFALPKPKGAAQVDFRDAASAFR